MKPSEEWLNKKDGLFLVFSKEGLGKYVSKNVTQRFAPGDVLVFNGTSGGTLSALDKGDLVFKGFSLFPEHLFPLFGSDEISLLQDVTDSFKATRLYPGNCALALECRQLLEAVPPQFNLEHRSHLLRIAAAILSVEFKNARVQRSSHIQMEDRMIHLFEKLSAAELLNLSVGELAVKFNCSRRHLNRLFHQHFRISVATLKMEMRLLNAVNLLRNPEAKIINVAEKCGFNHLGLFNTCFKRRFGASPGQWRKINLQNENSTDRKAKSQNNQICPLHATGLCSWSGPSKTPNRHDAIHGILSQSIGGNRAST
ncbi:MAG: helix-turn-helix domain-containing protein [Limisphaerales bacterium]